MTKKVFRVIWKILLAIIILAAAGLLFMTITEYRPQSIESVTPADTGASRTLSAGDSVTVLSWNVGYSGLGSGSDFFMDGGKNVRSADKATVQKYLSGIADTVQKGDGQSDIYMFQEVDSNSSRSYHIDERTPLQTANSTFAMNFSVKFVPYPIPPIGTVNSGLLTVSDYKIETAKRVSLPCPFSWPLRTANLKRCLLVNYIPIKDSDKYLVAVDLHLEAYDSGEGKIAQTNMLKEFIQQEYKKGNYVIAGGDFNQEFPGALEAYPNNHPDLWSPGTLDSSMLPTGWSFACDTSTPSCRLLNQPYDPSDTANTQYYVIDGFILSPNVKLESVNTLDEGFANSDHNPVQLKVTLEK
jgi:endonuclease/exonuclease/phosphatase family metal-dependent hydrolase